ncbi:HD domain-containing phosphohydrolase [Botrimarina sp.]|uniref:HD-GYP domain-containing protein n=1 Tax=Botrimarina sp. TaxID=2795802 RepID=UPI0032EAA06A
MSTLQTEQRLARADGFSSLPVQYFLTKRAPAVDVYAFFEGDAEPRLLAGREHDAPAAELEGWKRSGLSHVLVRKSDAQRVRQQLAGCLDELADDESLPANDRVRVLQSLLASTLEQRLSGADADAWIAEAKSAAERIVRLSQQSGVTADSLFQLAQHDTTTFVHATNVAAYAVLLAVQLGTTDAEELRQICSGALLHDYGKKFLPKALLTKRGRLDQQERALIESHAQRGFEALAGRSGVTPGQLMMVYQHHERLDGSGYPVALVGNEIHPWAKLLAVVDVFDALTAKRPYRLQAPVATALTELTESAGVQFDEEVVQCWVSIFKRKSRKSVGSVST